MSPTSRHRAYLVETHSKNAVFSSITNIFFMCHATGKLVATIGSSFVAWRMAKYFPVLTLRMVWPAPSGATSHYKSCNSTHSRDECADLLAIRVIWWYSCARDVRSTSVGKARDTHLQVDYHHQSSPSLYHFGG